jgi:hypothetical protein
VETASYHLLKARILRWLIDFWQDCAPSVKTSGLKGYISGSKPLLSTASCLNEKIVLGNKENLDVFLYTLNRLNSKTFMKRVEILFIKNCSILSPELKGNIQLANNTAIIFYFYLFFLILTSFCLFTVCAEGLPIREP